MLKHVFTVLLAFLFSLHADAQTITLTSPNGGEKLYTGNAYTVRWQSTALSSSFVKLEYSTDNGLNWLLIQSGANNTGSFAWTVPDGIASATCLVRVSDFSNAATKDESNAVFSIQKPFIKVTSPNGAEALTGCTTHKITWEQANTESYVNLYYSLDGGLNWLYITEVYVANNATSYNWSVPSLATTKAKIKIVGYTDKTLEDASDANFSMAKGVNSIVLTSPNGGESWSSSASKTITWTQTGTVGNVSLKYSKDGGATWDWVRGYNGSNANNVANTGSFEWVLPEKTSSANTLVQVYDYTNACIVDYSDNRFTIDNNPAITVMAPTKAEKLYVGRDYSIRYSASNIPTEYVKIEYSADNGVQWTTLVASTYNSGSYNWKVPNLPTTKALIRISAAENPAILGVNKEPFTITPATITVKTPNGGESLVGCTPYTITWEQEGVNAYVKLYYTLDGGLSWVYINEDYIADGSNSFAWTTPSTTSEKVRVKVVAYYDASVQDSSDANSSVAKGTDFITLTSPNGGQTFASSSNQDITWTNTGTVGNVSIKYSIDGGVTWDWVKGNNGSNASNIANTGSFTWLVPANTVTSKALVQVYDNAKPCLIASSAKVFTINNEPGITVTAPALGTKWYGGRDYTISWSSSNLPTTYVKVEYSADSGATWKLINANVYNSGSINWTAPKVYGKTYVIRVSSVATPTILGLSKAFTVASQLITVKTPNGGESLTGCTPYTITWDQEGVNAYVKLYYTLDGGLSWVYIDEDYIADGSNSFAWTTPSLTSDKVKIKVVGYYDATVQDSSNANLSITQGANYITLTSPNGGQTFASSSNQDITWTNTGRVGNVSLKYSIDGGVNWDWIKGNNGSNASNIANTGTFTWLVPANTVTSKALVQVYDASKTCVVASSAKVFAINNEPFITVTSPALASKWYAGRDYTISWSSSNLPTTYVKVEYSTDSGSTWTTINANVYNSGSISWTAPRTYTTRYLVKVSSVATPTIFGLSKKFAIAPQTITVKTPNGGESVPACGTYRVTWEQEGVNAYVNLYYSSDGGNIWYYAGEDYIADNTNYFDWTIPSIASTNFKIKVSGYYDATVKDSSDNVFTVSPGANLLTLVSPNGGENLPSSSLQRITWTTTGTVGNVSIKYSINGGNTWEWARNAAGSNASNIVNTGTFDWLVPANTVASKCLIQLYENTKLCVVDYSNNYFTINNSPTITVTAPVQGDNYYFGETKNITWSASNLTGNYLKIQYSLDSGQKWLPIIASVYNGGAHAWKVPAQASNKALIKITSTTDSSISGITNGAFKIVPPIIKVLTPNTGNENWLVGENKNITWTSTGLASAALIKIEYSTNKGQTWTKIKDSIPNSGSFIWTIPNIATSAQSFIKVSSTVYPVSKDSNDVAFTITKPIVGVTAPNDGQVWYLGESKSIQWAGVGTSANVKIELSSDSGKTYTTLIASTANTGQYFWTIPYTTRASTKSLIRISDALDASNSDVSDRTFTIAKPSITITSPNTAESWYQGQTKKISWTNVGISDSKVKIEYSGNKGATWTLVALANNTGTYNWTIPSTVLPSTNAYIKVSDENDPIIKDSNDVAFKIVKPSLHLTSPNGGELLYIGQTKVVTWIKDGSFSPNVKIDYSADNGVTWRSIIASVTNNESYAWALGNTLVPGTKYLLRIRDAVDSTISDFSDIPFEISKPTITVNYPNGGETFYPGDAKTISWNSAALASSRQVKIEWSSDNGATWAVISASVGNNGSFNWTPPTTGSGSQNLIRVSDVLDPTISDVSNAPFSMGQPAISVQLSNTELTEGATQGITAKITRTGAITTPITVNTSIGRPTRFTLPASITIPAGQSGTTFTITALDNSSIDGTIVDTLRVTSTGFQAFKAAITLLDNDKPSLSISELVGEAKEGDSVQFKIHTNLAPTKPLQVLLTTSNATRFPLPASITIPTGSLFTTVKLKLVQDNLPEVDIDVNIVAGAAGYNSATESITIKDDDIPKLALTIETKVVSESGGAYATQATLTRTSPDLSFAFTANLSASLPNTLIFPGSIPLEAGEMGKTFTIGVVDNKLVDGERKVNLTASVYVNSCGCNAPSTSAGTVSSELTVTDNDGPTLTLTASQLTLNEGLSGTDYIRVTRNTPSTTALSVTLTSSDTNEAKVPTTVVIPVGKDFVDVPVTTKNDGVTDGNKQVYFNVTATGYSAGSVWVIITDRNLPDLQIASVLAGPSVQAMGILNYQIGVKNSGFATAPNGVILKGYLSKDNTIDETDTLIATEVLTAVPYGQTIQVVNAIKAPNIAGDYQLLFVVNPTSVLTELLYTNNRSTPVALKLLPDYTVTAEVSSDYFTKGSNITIKGAAQKSTGAIAANSKVEVYILTNGLRRTVSATTDATGKYTATFAPIANESGYYTVGASFPGMGATTEQDNFNILGVVVNNGQLPQFKVVINDTLKGTVSVKNTSKRTLTNLTLAPVTLPLGAEIRFTTLSSLAGEATGTLSYRIVGKTLSPGTNFDVANLQVTSQEGTIQPLEAFYYCQAPSAYLVTDVTQLTVLASSSKGERQIEIKLTNKGQGESGKINVNLPQLTWLTAVTPKELPSLASGDTAVIILKFRALPEVPFDYPIKGSIAIVPQTGNSINLPFTFEKVSESTGTLLVSVTDQFTYYSESAPKVKNAHVKIQNYFTGVLYAEGNTDSSGVFTALNIPEGKHRILVDKEKHESYSGTVTIDPGDTTEATVFLNYKAITFNWSVVPTAVEDKYDITLVTNFETHVPMPVVTINMPKTMPQLSGSEVYAFNVILTNEGLITAKDVALTMPTDPEYEFVMNYVPSDLLAQQSIQVPVIMRRRADAPANPVPVASLQDISNFLGIEAAASPGSNCTGFSGVVYWYKCNFSTGLWEKNGVMFNYSGRICGGNGDGPGYHLVIPNNMWYPTCASCPVIPINPRGDQPIYTAERQSCKECIKKLIKVIIPCATGKRGKCLVNVIKAIWVCANTSSADAPTANSADDIDVPSAAPTATINAAFEEIATKLEVVSDAFDTKERWDTEYFKDMVTSDALAYFDTLTKVYTSKRDSIRPAAQVSILNAMKGYEIQPATIQAFFTRWNTSVHALKQGIQEPNTQYPSIINWKLTDRYADSIQTANEYAIDRGYKSVDDMYDQSFKDLNEIIDGQSNAVCASVKVQFSQQLTMTREAFEGTLEITNGHPTESMKQLSVNIQITDADGVPSNDLFEIQTKSLDNLSDITGTGVISAQDAGTVKFIFIPELGAAPQTPKIYNFGGSVRYWDPYAQTIVTIPLSNVPLTVNPSPNLMLHYFMQRNILGDDPFTKPAIEPSIPAELAVMVENQGYGPAVNMVISSAQPKIIENEKGLAIDFKLIGSNFQGQPKNLGVTDINFGTVPGLQTRIGQWYFTSSLLGKFVSYEAKVVHANSFGNPDLSLVKGVSIHELTKSVKAYGASEDVTNDFLVNDIFDVQDRPDILYFSQGNRTEKVYEATFGAFSAPVSAPTFTNMLTVTPSDTGWNYIKLADPGQNRYSIVSVTRNDGQVIPLDNAWLTFVTLPVGRTPVYENKFHFVDNYPNLSPVSYTIVWKPRDTQILEVQSLEGAEPVTATQVKHITVRFNKNVDASTFNYKDLNLAFQGGSNIIDSTVKVTRIDSVSFDIDLSKITTGNGFYNLIVKTLDIADTYGVNGVNGKNITWSQFLTVPTVQAFQGIPESRIATNYDKILLLFNLPIDAVSMTSERISIYKDSVKVDGTITIDSVSADKKLFYLSGLQNILKTSGVYSFRVDLPKIKTTTNVFGLEAQSILLVLDNSGPKVISLKTSTLGGLDPQHVASISIQFDEVAKGFNTSHVQLKRNGEILYLNIAQLSNTDLKNWRVNDLGFLTYPEGTYTFTVTSGGFTDAIGNVGTGTEQITWKVDRSALDILSKIKITPDLGSSDSDGVTSSQNLQLAFQLSSDVSSLTISQVDPTGESVLTTISEVKAGTVSYPITLLAGGNTSLKITATGKNGGVAVAQKALFIDQVPLTAKWTRKPNPVVTRQVDTVQVVFSSKLLPNATLLNGFHFTKDGVQLPVGALKLRAINDTVYELSGIRSSSSVAGNYQLAVQLASFSKFSSGKTGEGTLTANWEVQVINHPPIALTGRDTLIQSEGTYFLNGSTSSDPDGDAITYRWVAPAGLALLDTASATPSFTVNRAVANNTYSFLLIVSDGSLFSTATVSVKVNLPPTNTCFQDLDQDGYGNDSVKTTCNTPQVGYVAYGGDCNDNDPTIFPSAKDIKDGKDNDCNGVVDEGDPNSLSNALLSKTLLELNVYPVPSESHFNVSLFGWSASENTQLKVYNNVGVVVEIIENISVGETIVLGAKYTKGLYVIEAIQGNLRKSIKITKL